MLYLLVGIQILKQKRFFKSVANTYVTLDTDVSVPAVSLTHPSPAVILPAGSKSHINPSHDPSAGDIKAPHSASSSTTTGRRPSIRSPVSFKQYILMPLTFFVVLLLVWVALTVNRVLSFINPHFVSYPLLLCVGATGCLRGFWNGIVFVVIGVKARKRQKKLVERYR
jgi:hypothetical protein